MKVSKFICFLIYFYSCAGAQNFAKAQNISGTVVDSKTLEPLPFANVFFNNSTIGTVTDLKGNFNLQMAREQISVELIFSFVGYLPFVKKINQNNQDVNLGILKLTTSETELSKVEISSNRDGEWEKKLKKFKKIFLGTDKDAAQCKIINPWVIDFEPTASNGEIRAKATEPIEIENHALGYKIMFYLSSLWANSNGYLISGNALFTEMKAEKDEIFQQWVANRRKAFLHSPHNLFKSIVKNRIDASGFKLYAEAPEFKNASIRSSSFYSDLGIKVIPYDTSGIVFMDISNNTYKIQLKGSVEVHYSKQKSIKPIYEDVSGPVSWISLKKGFVLVTKEGFPLNQEDIIVSGEMSLGRVARMLPIDYRPFEKSASDTDEIDWSFYQEQIYLHTDRPYYHLGDTIWLKGYINYHFPAWRDSLSKTVYIELLDRTNRKVVTSKIVRVDSGLFHNDLVIPANLSSLYKYYLRAYTNLNRNFGDKNLFIKPIPILTQDQTFEEVDTTKNLNSNYLTVHSSKSNYSVRENIVLTFSTSDEDGNPISSNFSVSVTDMNQVPSIHLNEPITSTFTIKKSPLIPFKEQLDYSVEYGIDFSGTCLFTGKQQHTEMLQLVQLDPPNFLMSESDLNGNFKVNGLVFYDTSKFAIQPLGGKKNTLRRVDVHKKKIPPIDFDEIKYDLKIASSNNSKKNGLNFETNGGKTLNTVEIRAKKVTAEKPINRLIRPYGKPDYVLTRKDINSSYGNLLQTLPGKVPGLVVRQASNAGKDSGNEWVVYIAKGGNSSSIQNVSEVLITINDVVINGKPEQILSAIDPNTVESVEVKTGVNVLYGSLSGNGIISIYTRKDIEPNLPANDPSIIIFKVPGYSPIRKFFNPNYSKINPKKSDNRVTIYWNPNVVTHAETGGTTSISFFSSDYGGLYRVSAEGLNSKQQPIMCNYYIKIVNDK